MAANWRRAAVASPAAWLPGVLVGMSAAAALFGVWRVWGTQAAVVFLAAWWPWLLIGAAGVIILSVFVLWFGGNCRSERAGRRRGQFQQDGRPADWRGRGADRRRLRLSAIYLAAAVGPKRHPPTSMQVRTRHGLGAPIQGVGGR